MRKQILILWLICVSVLTGCKKKDPIETTEAPVFSFTGKINGNYVDYSSGINDYYMFSSFGVDANNVKEFIGELKNKNCGSVCANSLKLIIKDYRSLSSLATKIDSSVTTGYYGFATPSGNPISYSVTFVPQFAGGTASTYTWNFGDGSTSNTSSPTHIYTRPGKYNVCANILSTTSCGSSLCNSIPIGQLGTNVESGFSSSLPTGNVISFTAQAVQGTPPYTYLWNFGDSNTSTLSNPTHTYLTSGVYLTSLTVTDSKNTSSTYQNNVATQTPGNCMTRFSFIKTAINNPFNFFNIVLEWTDTGGIVYSSNNNQSAFSGFKITSVEEYNQNENGQKTKKINAIVNCTLYNGTTSILVEDAQLIFAVAY